MLNSSFFPRHLATSLSEALFPDVTLPQPVAVQPAIGCCSGKQRIARVAPAPESSSENLFIICSLLDYLSDIIVRLRQVSLSAQCSPSSIEQTVEQLDKGTMKKPNISTPPVRAVLEIEDAIRCMGAFVEHPALKFLLIESDEKTPLVQLARVQVALRNLLSCVSMAASLVLLRPFKRFTPDWLLDSLHSSPISFAPTELLLCCRSISLSATVSTLWDAARTGDRATGELHPSFALLSLTSIIFPAGGLIPSLLSLPDSLTVPLPAILLFLDGSSKFLLLRTLLGPRPLLRLPLHRLAPLSGILAAICGANVSAPEATVLHPTFYLECSTEPELPKVGGEVHISLLEEDGVFDLECRVNENLKPGSSKLQGEGEVGEGQGLRVELFMQCGREATTEFTEWVEFIAEVRDGILFAVNLEKNKNVSPSRLWGCEVFFPQGISKSDSSFQALIVHASNSLEISLDSPLPSWLLNAGGLIGCRLRYPTQPLFEWIGENGYHWPRPYSISSMENNKMAQLVALGWVLGAVPLNGAKLLPLQLPPAFFSLLFFLMERGDVVNPRRPVRPGSVSLPLILCPPHVQAFRKTLEGLTEDEVIDYIESPQSTESTAATGSSIYEKASNSRLSLYSSGFPRAEMHAIFHGFSLSVPQRMLSLCKQMGVTALDWAEGGGHSKIAAEALSPPLSQLFRVVTCRDFTAPSGVPTVESLWEVLERWRVREPPLLSLFLKFVTGTSFPPLSKARAL